MNLSVNPYTVIRPPKFGSKQDNEDVAKQWNEWRSAVKHVHSVFKKLQDKKKSMGATSVDFQRLISTLQLSSDFVQKSLRDDMSLTASVHGYAIIEAANRFLFRETMPDMANCDENGWTEWEYQILQGK